MRPLRLDAGNRGPINAPVSVLHTFEKLQIREATTSASSPKPAAYFAFFFTVVVVFLVAVLVDFLEARL